MNSQRLDERIKIYFSVTFQLAKCFIFSCFLVLVLYPLLEKSKYFIDVLQTTDKNTLIGITAFILFFIFTTWSTFNNFWRKYKNTYRTTITKFTHVDYIFSIVFFSILLIVLTSDSTLKISYEFKYFLGTNSILLLIFFLTSYFWTNKSSSIQTFFRKPRDEVSDEPIHYLDEDLLNRELFVQGLYEEIEELNIVDSFVFGLYGNWGEGKTSVLNLLRVMLQSKSKFIVMNFEPWNFKDEEAMLKAFFTTLEQTLNKEYTFPHLKKLLFKYQHLLSSGLAGMGIKLDFGIEEESIEEIKEKIEHYISDTGKKLLIIVDEIDRLEAEEIKLIFKLVRSNSKFKNSIFLLSLDDEKTAQKIDPDGREFIEKIIQKPIALPKAEHNYIDKFVLFSEHKIPQYTISEVLKSGFEEIVSTFGYVKNVENGHIEISESLEENSASITVYLDEKISADFKLNEKLFIEGVVKKEGIFLSDPISGITSFKLSRIDLLLERMWREKKVTLEQIAYFDKEFVHLYRTQITNLIEDFRDAKRFLNSLSSSYPPIANEVNPFDFICLEIIKVFAKDIYNEIYENWWFYVDQRFEGDSLSNPYTFAFSSQKEKRDEQTAQHVNDVLRSAGLRENQREVIRQLMYTIFPNLHRERSVRESDRKEKRIFTSSFLKYFTLKVPSTELSDAFFEYELKSWKTTPSASNLQSSYSKLQKQGKLMEFLDKLRRIYLESLPADLVPILLDSLSSNIKEFSKRDRGDLWDSEYDRALMLVLRTLNFRTDKSKIQDEIHKMLISTSDMLFAVDLVLTTKKERNGDLYTIYENIDHLALRKLLADRLENHFIVGKNNILKEDTKANGWLRILYQWSSNWGDVNTPYKEKVAKYIVSIFKNDLKSFVEFLKSFNAGTFGTEWNMDYDQYDRIYDLKILAGLAELHLKGENLEFEHNDIMTRFIKIIKSKSHQ